MLIIRNNIIPFKGFKAINICGVLFVRGNAYIDDVTINHESIHTEQIKECLVVGFYVLYLVFWIVNLFVYGFNHNAYREIFFEREAYEHERDMKYLNNRKHFAWINS